MADGSEENNVFKMMREIKSDECNKSYSQNEILDYIVIHLIYVISMTYPRVLEGTHSMDVNAIIKNELLGKEERIKKLETTVNKIKNDIHIDTNEAMYSQYVAGRVSDAILRCKEKETKEDDRP